MKKIKRWLTKEYVKFVLGQCKHVCLFCKWKSDCLPYFIDEYENVVNK